MSAAGPEWRASEEEIARLVGARHGDPFGLLGLHEAAGGMALRAFVPGALRLEARPLAGKAIPLERRGDEGFFEAFLSGVTERFRYRLHAANAGGDWEFDDPYGFGPVLGPLDDHLMAEGTHRRLFERLGAHAMRHEGTGGVHFALWAPNAERVSVVGDFNRWDGRTHQMRRRVDSGIWELFAPGVGEGTNYKYEIVGADGTLLPLKADPFGFGAELRPSTASVVTGTDDFSWTDAAYLETRAQGEARRAPLSIYEVHLGSWRRHDDGGFQTYDELAEQLIPYVVDLGFSAIELLPVSEHPLDISWGYQPIGLFAPTRRFGDPRGFARFVDRAHAAGIAVILDWVPAHFPTDPHGLSHFDGTALYEHRDPRQGFHPDWNTAIYNFGRREVVNYLTANALYWLERFHIDGLRVDAVASMLYLDYSRRSGEWIPNPDGSNDNREAAAFLRHVNRLAYGEHPGIVTIAEESTAWSGVSRPVHEGGLGFGFKWNMGWMHDTLDYFSHEPVHRRWHHGELSFSLVYAFSENFILPLSHDEVVHGKGSLLARMPGDGWQKFANLRALYGFMWGHPGKKLLFMGQEFAQGEEWNCNRGLEWHLVGRDQHRGVQALVRDLNLLYREQPALHARDCEGEGFRWIVIDDADQSVFAWLRDGGDGRPIAVVCNLTPVPRLQYRVGLPFVGRWREVINTDAAIYGGSGMGNFGAVQAEAAPSHGFPASATLTLPPLAAIFLHYIPE